VFQDDKDLVHEFVVAEGLTCLIKVGAEADQNYQNYILRALGQIMLYVDGMNGVIGHNETIQWLYTLIGSKFRLVVKTALKLLLVFVEYTESNTQLLIEAVSTVDNKRGTKIWSNAMEILDEKDGVDTELLVYAMTLVNKTLAGLSDQDSFYDVVDSLEEQGIEVIAQRHLNKKGTDLDLVEQFNMYEMTLRHEDGDDDSQPPPAGRKDRRRASLGGANERHGLERRRSRRHSIQNTKGPTSSPVSPNGFMSYNGQRIEDLSENRRPESYLAFQGDDQPETDSVFEAEFAPWPIEEEEEQPITEPNTEDEGEEEPSRQVKHSQADATYSSKYSDPNDPYYSRYNSYGSSSPYTSSRTYSTLSAPTTPTSHYGTSVSPSPDSKTDRPVLGGLLTSSYRQHQESLAAERERRRQEREERLLRIEREERNKFNRDYMDKREEQKHAREERYNDIRALLKHTFLQIAEAKEMYELF
ncbi:FH1/FH2 domain-containing protein 3, partial [Acipenser ruthenus]